MIIWWLDVIFILKTLSLQEIDQNYAMMLRTQHRAKELEAANKTVRQYSFSLL
jgi:hypothetical protein